MSDPIKAAREYLKGLSTRERKPWDEPVEDERPASDARPSPKPAPQSGDDIGKQVERIAERNREFAKRTRHLRKDY